MSHRRRVSQINGEKIIPEFILPSLTAYMPQMLKPVWGKLLELLGEKRVAEVLSLQSTSSYVKIL